MAIHGTFTWNELASTDPRKAMEFYAETLGWTFEEYRLPDGDYWVASCNGELVGGLGDMASGAIPGEQSSYWFGFIEVDDVDARVAKALALGATIIEAPTDVPNVGRVAVIRDPTGAAIGWMTGAE